jgi:hypothetical protein
MRHHIVRKSNVVGETGLNALRYLEDLRHEMMDRNRSSVNLQSGPSGMWVAPRLNRGTSSELPVPGRSHPEYIAAGRGRNVYIPFDRDL